MDPVLIHTLLEVARYLHNTLDSLSLPTTGARSTSSSATGWRSSRSATTSGVPQRVRRLPRSVSNVELIKGKLVHGVLRLIMRVRLVKGVHRRTGIAEVGAGENAHHRALIRRGAAAAAAHALCAQVSLANGCVAQTDMFCKEAIKEVENVPRRWTTTCGGPEGVDGAGVRALPAGRSRRCSS